MQKIDYLIQTKVIYIENIFDTKDKEVFRIYSDYDGDLSKTFLKIIRHNTYSFSEFQNLSDDELLQKMIVKELPKPKKWPIFNNEIPFAIHFNNKTFRNPEIIRIRWDGYQWQYQLKNIGHITDYQNESELWLVE